MSLRITMVAALVVAVAGIVLLALQAGRGATAAGAALFGVGGVVLVSGAFYAIGRSEDRERASRGPRP